MKYAATETVSQGHPCVAGHMDWQISNIRDIAGLIDVRFMSLSSADSNGSGQ
jgi:hypothetical protein